MVGYFCYQVAYGYTIGQNETMTVTNSTNGLSATFTAPPGTNVSNIRIVPEGPPVNSTDIKDSGAISVVPPNVNATKTYLDLSNPDGKPPVVHHDPLDAKAYYHAWRRERHINTTSTTWTMYNATSGSVSPIRFTDCNEDDYSGGIMTCQGSNSFYRHLNGHTISGMWSLYYPPYLTPNESLGLCTFNAHHYQSPCIEHDLIVKKLGRHHIELIDSHGGRIQLMR